MRKIALQLIQMAIRSSDQISIVEKALPTLIQTNETIKPTQIDIF